MNSLKQYILYVNHQEWLVGTTNHHEAAATDFATLSDGDQLVIGPTRAQPLDHLLTDTNYLRSSMHVHYKYKPLFNDQC